MMLFLCNVQNRVTVKGKGEEREGRQLKRKGLLFWDDEDVLKWVCDDNFKTDNIVKTIDLYILNG